MKPEGSKAAPVAPSRTYTLSASGLGALTLLALGTLLVAAWEPTALAMLDGAIGSIALAIAAVSGGGSAAMAARDYSSRGLTSSQGALVLAARRLEAQQGLHAAPPTGPDHLGLPAGYAGDDRSDAPEDLA